MSHESTGVFVVEIKHKEKHPDADTLEIIRIDGYTVISKIGEYNLGSLAAYVPPESQIDTNRPEFAFLKKNRQFEVIKVRKMRGVYSQGLLVPVPAEFTIGQDVTEYFGVTHYQPTEEEKMIPGDCEKSPVNVSKYDVDSMRKYRYCFKVGEPVLVTEKVHGCFRADTLVLTETGYIAIKDIKPNDIVASYSEKTKEFKTNKVLATLCRPSNGTKWRKLTLENGKEITCTEHHLFLTKTGWVEARNLTPQHEIISVS